MKKALTSLRCHGSLSQVKSSNCDALCMQSSDARALHLAYLGYESHVTPEIVKSTQNTKRLLNTEHYASPLPPSALVLSHRALSEVRSQSRSLTHTHSLTLSPYKMARLRAAPRFLFWVLAVL
jgi:hypothetical protein